MYICVYIDMCICTLVCVFVCVCVYMYVYIYIYTYICICTHIYVYFHTNKHPHLCTNTRTHICICINMNTHMYKYILNGAPRYTYLHTDMRFVCCFFVPKFFVPRSYHTCEICALSYAPSVGQTTVLLCASRRPFPSSSTSNCIRIYRCSTLIYIHIYG